MEPDCEICLDVGELYIIEDEANGDGHWMDCVMCGYGLPFVTLNETESYE